MKELLKKLTETYGPSGSEEKIRATIKAEIEGIADEVRTDALGNLIAFRKGKGGGKRVMVAAHMDEIGVIVTHVDENGFLRFSPIGGMRLLSLLGGRAIFADGTVGTFGLEKLEDPNKVPNLDKFFLDVGAKDKASVPVKVGDVAAFLRPFVDGGDRLMAKACDDRVGCAVLVQAIRELKSSPNDVYFVFTTQEEVGLRGATTSAYGLEPDLALAVDVTVAGDTPEVPASDVALEVALGKGPAIKVKDRGMLAHPQVKELLIQRAEAEGIPYQLEILSMGTTDAMAMQTSRAGVPTGVISVPCRYIHTPSEMVDYKDVSGAVRLLVATLAGPIEI